MSSKCDVTAITAQVNLLNESSVTFESFVLRAASRAFTKAFPEVETQNIARVVQDSEELGVKIHERANESRMSDFASQELAAGVYGHDSGEAISACPLTITHVRNSTESLPIVNHAALISLHFTQPRTEVIHGGLVPGQTFDIETLEDEDLNYDLSLKVAQTAKISISYDIQKVDDIQAGKYMQYLKTFLDDPELMLL
jgi:pyruvate/2-oxoglutarate dehydrogenase complex dihydrolipoamide acyltransferase (E2) component